MRRVIGSTMLTLALLAGCGNDDDVAEPAPDVEELCAMFDATMPGLGGATTSFAEALTFFSRLEPVSPPEIAEEVATVADGLERLAEAFGEYQGVEAERALEAIQAAAEVDLAELSDAAEEIEQFASRHCVAVNEVG